MGDVLGARDDFEGAEDRLGMEGRPLPILAMLSTGVRLLRPEAVDESDPKGLLDLPHPLSRSFFQSSSDLTAGSVVAAPLAGLGRAPLGRGSVRARAVRALTDLRRAVESRWESSSSTSPDSKSSAAEVEVSRPLAMRAVSTGADAAFEWFVDEALLPFDLASRRVLRYRVELDRVKKRGSGRTIPSRPNSSVSNVSSLKSCSLTSELVAASLPERMRLGTE